MTSGPKSKLCLEAPAKVNLCLRIVGKRSDGYHDLQSLMVPLTIGDRLEVEEAQAWEAVCDRPDVPVGPGSLIEKAFRFAAGRLDYRKGLSLRLSKVTPMGAGLGGGSSDAAAVIRGVERVTGRLLPEADYAQVAFRIGADVPFFLRDGAKWVEGVGERVTPVTQFPALNVLLINPGIHIATKWVYENLTLTSPNRTASLPRAFLSIADLLPFVTNDLESVVLPHYPEVAEIKRNLGALGADAALMSGSGSTVFGLFADPKKRDQALVEIKSAQPKWWVCAASNLVR